MKKDAIPPRPGWYRGVKLQAPVRPPTMPLANLRAAVEAAIEKNKQYLRSRDGGQGTDRRQS
ncbi:hypothetical protein [Phenylobacterium soli]|uniref:hypothetical protein n=1 Tax=Phenylobacterium soli TaxID=2170551 RepID=UPI001057B203|nr:hypothetical protein [Phenylobacterium soli]